MYRMIVSDGRKVDIFENSFRRACLVAEEYVNYYYGFAAHKMDYELEKLTDEVKTSGPKRWVKWD